MEDATRLPDGSTPATGAAPVATARLCGDVEAEYVRRAVALVRQGNLNSFYPDARALTDHLASLSPACHRGLYGGLEIDLRSGLPTYREWVRVVTDRRMAPDVLADLGAEEKLRQQATAAGADPIWDKQLRKLAYYRELEARRVAPLGEMRVALRKVEPKEKRAYFTVVLDKLDATGCFVRFTVDLAQTDSFWNRRLVQLDEDAAKHTEELRATVYRYTTLDAEFTFFELARFGQLLVERVVKGTVGPLWFAGGAAGGPLHALLGPHPHGVVASFALDMAATDLAEDRDNDPVEDLMAASLSGKAREDYEQARERYGYRVFKDRKFVASPELAADLRAFCDAAGTKNVIKTLAGG